MTCVVLDLFAKMLSVNFIILSGLTELAFNSSKGTAKIIVTIIFSGMISCLMLRLRRPKLTFFTKLSSIKK
jgi:hypothetical protein